MDELKLGFIGFGEAGFHLAKGLRAAGLTQLFAYDINTHSPDFGAKIQGRATESAVQLVATSADLARNSDVLLSLVTAPSAAEAAEQTAPFLEKRHLYVDLNSVSPALKEKIDRIISERAARFVEASIMAPVAPYGHLVPILLGGVHAPTLFVLLKPYGMSLEIVSDRVGSAAAVKMCRSIVIKGLEALLFECAIGASRYGADERVFASLDESLPGMDWARLTGYTMGRVLEHGERRAREMDEVAETLRAVGIEPIMSEAISRTQEWGGQLNLVQHFGGQLPTDYREVVRFINNNLNTGKGSVTEAADSSNARR